MESIIMNILCCGSSPYCLFSVPRKLLNHNLPEICLRENLFYRQHDIFVKTSAVQKLRHCHFQILSTNHCLVFCKIKSVEYNCQLIYWTHSMFPVWKNSTTNTAHTAVLVIICKIHKEVNLLWNDNLLKILSSSSSSQPHQHQGSQLVCFQINQLIKVGLCPPSSLRSRQ